ncbi:MAG: glutamate formimidoyltransferase [Pyrinomonadaceae bacterium]|nr:glutamate formimidoyltransferase [Pyrinomonadaceae bacterium]
MERLVECVPNFSEGREFEIVDRLVSAIESVGGAVVLNVHTDADHNRSVITFVASPKFVVEAAVRVVVRAAKLIDIRAHKGEHPRFGATDVLPFVPLQNISMDECVKLAHEAGERIWREAKIPVYFYERAALRPERARLETVRRGGLEALRSEIETNPLRAPDIGERKIHETAGAIIIGARSLLIAFNINLRTNDIEIARRIARVLRASNGGLPDVKALGINLQERGIVQVSMNFVNYERTNLHQAFEIVQREAAQCGVEIAGSEIVGLIPQAALESATAHSLQIENFSPNLVLEDRIKFAFEKLKQKNELR